MVGADNEIEEIWDGGYQWWLTLEKLKHLSWCLSYSLGASTYQASSYSSLMNLKYCFSFLSQPWFSISWLLDWSTSAAHCSFTVNDHWFCLLSALPLPPGFLCKALTSSAAKQISWVQLTFSDPGIEILACWGVFFFQAQLAGQLFTWVIIHRSSLFCRVSFEFVSTIGSQAPLVCLFLM